VVFCVAKPRSGVVRHRRFRRWRQWGLPKRCYPTAPIHGVTIQKPTT